MNKKIISDKLKDWWPLVVVAIVFILTFAVVWGIRSARLNDTKALVGDDLRETVVLSAGDVEVDGAMFSYYMYNTYRSFLNYYGNSATSYYGLNPSVSLKGQNHPDGGTWFAYFADIARAEVEKAMVMVSEAEKAGVSLTENELSIIADNAAAYPDDQLVNGITREDVSRAMQLQSLAIKYRTMLTANLEISQNDLDERAQADQKLYSRWNYRTYSIFYVDEAVEGTENVGNTREEAEALANELLTKTTEEEYIAWVAAHLQEIKGREPEAADNEARTRSLKTGSAYSEGNKLSEWAYEDGRKAGDITLLHSPESAHYTVVYMITPPQVNDSPTVNVRHILVEEQALAEDLLARWQSGDSTAQSFGELAAQYTTDTASIPTGGRYPNVAQGEMVTEFDAWCFDSARKAGDSGLVQTSYGWHIMYYEGAGLPLWKAMVMETMQAERYEEAYASLAANYTVTADEKAIDRIPG